MLSVDLGSVVELSWTSTAAGAASLTLTLPDGTTQAGDVVDTNATHTASVTAGMAGRWLASWSIPGGDVYTDVLDVWPSDPRFLISLADARNALNLTTIDATRDDALRLYIAAATPIIEDICGAILPVKRSESGDGSRAALLLPDTDVSDVTVTVDGAPPAVAPVVDTAAGVVLAGGQDFGGQIVTVTYTAGTGVVPPNVRLATRELVRFLWQIGKQGARPTTQQQSEAAAWTPSGFAVPRRVIELCAPQSQIGGFG